MGFKENIERDWGDPNIYGPWTKELEKNNPPLPPGKFKFYKSYYLISYRKSSTMNGEPTEIETFKPDTNDE